MVRREGQADQPPVPFHMVTLYLLGESSNRGGTGTLAMKSVMVHSNDVFLSIAGGPSIKLHDEEKQRLHVYPIDNSSDAKQHSECRLTDNLRSRRPGRNIPMVPGRNIPCLAPPAGSSGRNIPMI